MGNNQCLDSCPDGYYNDNGFCKRILLFREIDNKNIFIECEEGCTICTGPGQCSACKAKYFLDGTICPSTYSIWD